MKLLLLFTVVLEESHAHLLRCFFPFSKTDQSPGLDFSNYGSPRKPADAIGYFVR